MRQSALAQILSIACNNGEAFTLSIGMTGESSFECKFLRFFYLQQENLLEVEYNGKPFYIDGDKIEVLMVNK